MSAAQAARRADELRQIRQQILSVYQQHQPSKITLIDALLQEWEGQEHELLEQIKRKHIGSAAAKAGAPLRRTATAANLSPTGLGRDAAEDLQSFGTSLAQAREREMKRLAASGSDADLTVAVELAEMEELLLHGANDDEGAEATSRGGGGNSSSGREPPVKLPRVAIVGDDSTPAPPSMGTPARTQQPASIMAIVHSRHAAEKWRKRVNTVLERVGKLEETSSVVAPLIKEGMRALGTIDRLPLREPEPEPEQEPELQPELEPQPELLLPGSVPGMDSRSLTRSASSKPHVSFEMDKVMLKDDSPLPTFTTTFQKGRIGIAFVDRRNNTWPVALRVSGMTMPMLSVTVLSASLGLLVY